MKSLFVFLAVIVGPWVTNMHDGAFSVLWTTDKESTAFVQLEDGSRIYDTFAGRRVHSRFHRVDVPFEEAGSIVSYSIGNADVLEKENPRRPKYAAEAITGPYSVRTFDASAGVCRFSAMNDIHMNTGRYSRLASQIDRDNTDFVFLIGDIITCNHFSIDSLARYEIAPLGGLASNMPVMFARGNHEGRGDGIRNVAAVFPSTGREDIPFSYMFRVGPAAFVVLDAGETGVKNSRAFCGEDVYEPYLRAQMEWFKNEVATSGAWLSAKKRICLIHVPMIDFHIPDDYVVHGWMNRNFVPLLNDAGVNLMLSADLHEPVYMPVGSNGNDFPILVNSTKTRVDVSVDGDRILVRIFNVDGLEKEYIF